MRKLSFRQFASMESLKDQFKRLAPTLNRNIEESKRKKREESRALNRELFSSLYESIKELDDIINWMIKGGRELTRRTEQRLGLSSAILIMNQEIFYDTIQKIVKKDMVIYEDQIKEMIKEVNDQFKTVKDLYPDPSDKIYTMLDLTNEEEDLNSKLLKLQIVLNNKANLALATINKIVSLGSKIIGQGVNPDQNKKQLMQEIISLRVLMNKVDSGPRFSFKRASLEDQSEETLENKLNNSNLAKKARALEEEYFGGKNLSKREKLALVKKYITALNDACKQNVRIASLSENDQSKDDACRTINEQIIASKLVRLLKADIVKEESGYSPLSVSTLLGMSEQEIEEINKKSEKRAEIYKELN